MIESEDQNRKRAEGALLARAQAGNRDAIEEIFNEHRQKVYSLAYRMTGNPSDAEDLCQEVFLQVMRKIGSFQGRASLSTWLYTVTINRSRDFLRSKKRTGEVLSQDGEPFEPQQQFEPTGSVPAPEASAVSSEAQRLVQKALMELPLSLRAPIVLHELEGFEYREVARLLRLPVGTVKSRIFRGRLKLGELLEPYKEHWS
jgi:RNA polymerase sigma-70 factor (ECF subfamily)